MKNEDKLLHTSDEDLEHMLQSAWLGLGDIRSLDIDNQMLSKEWDDPSRTAELIVDTILNPDYLHFFVKYVLNIDLLPYQLVILHQLWTKPFPMVITTRGGAKSFIVAVYCVVRACLHQGCRIVATGAGLRQSMVLFYYIMDIWKNAPVLRDICGGAKFAPKQDIDMPRWNCGNSIVCFIPLGDGSKIRGLRANVIIADEFHSIPETVFDTVVRGFASTKSDSVFQSAVQGAKEKLLKKMDIPFSKEAKKNVSKLRNVLGGNQIVISGTTSYQFNHFYRHYRLYKAIILSGGDPDFIKRYYPDLVINFEETDPRDYSIIRLPYDAMPPGMMDLNILNQGKSTMDPTIFNMEYGAVFPSDSNGFFLGSYIKNATVPLIDAAGQNISFMALRKGSSDKFYVMGIDPASEDDNFAISILELGASYRGYVYQWTTNRKEFEKLKRNGLIDATIADYHTFCIKHIRDLCRRFNIAMVVVDAGGGGVHIREGLKDPDKMIPGDLPILDMDDETIPMYTKGHKILKMIEFSSGAWRRDAHYGLRKDIIDRVLLFPSNDAAEITAISTKEGINYDTTEDTYYEIIECINEMIRIQHTATPGGTERWDVPDLTGVNAALARKQLKKDRFTSLLLSNWGARLLNNKTGYVHDSSIYTAVKRGGSGLSESSRNSSKVSVIQSKSGRKIFY